MGKIIGGIATSHAPQLIMPALQWPDLPDRSKGPFNPKPDIARDITPDAMVAKQVRNNRALGVLRDQIAAWKPDILIVVGDDQHENVQDDNQPPFLIYMGAQTDATRHFLYLGDKAEDQMTRYPVASDLARSVVTGLMDEGFDPAWATKCREHTGLGHAFGRPLHWFMPTPAIPVLPIMVNTYFPPAPSAKRCLTFGAALRKIVETTPDDKRIVVVASGGLSHFIIDETFDQDFIAAIEKRDLDFLGAIPASKLVFGTSEMLCWIILAGAMNGRATMVDYNPCYRNANGIGCAMGFAIWKDA